MRRPWTRPGVVDNGGVNDRTPRTGGALARLVRGVALAAVGAVLVVGTAACSFRIPVRTFVTYDEAKTELLSGLQAKYGFPFVIVADKPFSTSAVTYYTAVVANASDPKLTADASLSEWGDRTDDYARNLYRDRIEGLATAVCAGKAYVLECRAYATVPMTATTWTAATPYETFTKASGVYNDVRIVIEAQASDDTSADQVFELLSGLYGCGVGFQVEVSAGGKQLYLTRYEPGNTKFDKATVRQDVGARFESTPAPLPSYR